MKSLMSDIEEETKDYLNKNIQVLDCTLRDGGLGFEDKIQRDSDIKVFSPDDIEKIIHLLTLSGVDYVELGSLQNAEQNMEQFAIYKSIEEISKKIADKKTNYTALFRGPDMDLNKIPNYNDSLVSYVRLIVRYSEIEKSLDFCEALVQKGYKVFVQPMVTIRYTNAEIDYLIKRSNEMKAHALYFVDSYGCVLPQEVKYYFQKYDEELDTEIKIGFHGHNNLNMAFPNALELLSQNSNRGLIIDSTVLGTGQGAGNLQTELFLNYLIKKYKMNYNFDAILDTCEIIEKYSSIPDWGYSLAYLLPALNRVAYKYSTNMRHKGLKYKEIYHLLSNMPDDLRYRYTLENENKIYERL